jgi:DNA-binding NtrC family response regulator
MEYAWIVSGGSPIAIHHLPHEVRHPNPRLAAVHHDPIPITRSATIPFPTSAHSQSQPTGAGKTLADIEMEYILQVYAKNGHNKQATAAELGISLKTLYNKLHKYEEELRLRAG